MVVKNEKTTKCRHCKAKIILYEYFGMEGCGWYTDHYCDVTVLNRQDKKTRITHKRNKK